MQPAPPYLLFFRVHGLLYPIDKKEEDDDEEKEERKDECCGREVGDRRAFRASAFYLMRLRLTEERLVVSPSPSLLPSCWQINHTQMLLLPSLLTRPQERDVDVKERRAKYEMVYRQAKKKKKLPSSVLQSVLMNGGGMAWRELVL